MFNICWQEWKTGKADLNSKYKYDPEPPEDVDAAKGIDLKNFPMKLVEVKVNTLKLQSPSFTEKYQFDLPKQVRLLYHGNPVYGAEWAAAIKDFDARFLDSKMTSPVSKG